MWPVLKLAFHSGLRGAVVWEAVVKKRLGIRDLEVCRVVWRGLGVEGSSVWRYKGLLSL